MPDRLALLAAALPLLIAAGPIAVAVTDVHDARGRIHVDICPQAKFLSDDCPYVAEAPAIVGTTVVTVPNVPPGRYAAQVFHDRNGNGKVDRGLFGIPSEPMGFSRDAPTPWRAPKWEEAFFDHGADPQRITLKLRKLP
jgi:uncharacterized protein (DUF2141 family)